MNKPQIHYSCAPRCLFTQQENLEMNKFHKYITRALCYFLFLSII